MCESNIFSNDPNLLRFILLTPCRLVKQDPNSYAVEEDLHETKLKRFRNLFNNKKSK